MKRMSCQGQGAPSFIMQSEKDLVSCGLPLRTVWVQRVRMQLMVDPCPDLQISMAQGVSDSREVCMGLGEGPGDLINCCRWSRLGKG